MTNPMSLITPLSVHTLSAAYSMFAPCLKLTTNGSQLDDTSIHGEHHRNSPLCTDRVSRVSTRRDTPDGDIRIVLHMWRFRAKRRCHAEDGVRSHGGGLVH